MVNGVHETGVAMPEAKEDPEDVTVSTVDDVSDAAHSHDRPRTLGEYEPTNMPLSESEIEKDEARDPGHAGWAPRSTENIEDLLPLPERPAVP
jgi:hypothetical protein